GNRYSNLQIFANAIAPPIPNGASIYDPGIYSDIQVNSNEILYFKPGAIVRGNISIVDKNNVQIMGRGMVDMIDYRKRYDTLSMNPPYESKPGISIRRSQNVGIDGILINDPQAYAVEIVESDTININNLKAFTRVLWGDGIDMVGTSNVTINDCYMRTSDDCIAIYASRVRDWAWQNMDALNITVSNCALYADAAHPVEIGWHGNQGMDGSENSEISVDGNSIYNLRFDNIDILEHDQPDEIDSAYQGAISINCGDKNKCVNFLFKDIRIEDFSD